MAQTVLAVAALYLVVGFLAYAVTLSGREVTYMAPLSVEAEVGMGLLFMCAAATALLAAAAALLGAGWLGTVVGATVGVAFVAGTAGPLLHRWRSDVAKVRARRAARDERRHG